MNIVVFDTETTNLEKPFCYNIGYVIADIESGNVLIKKDFVVEQVWHNPMLFTTAYYVEKRDIYISRMKGKKAQMEKFGYICQEMIRDFKAYNIELAFAYNSPFDKKVFEYNCEWFKCNNPFDNIEIKDIMCYVHKCIAFSNDYQQFCEKYQFFTDSGNYSTNAETVFRYLENDISFQEEHTALADSMIELYILKECINSYCLDITANYTRYSLIPRKVTKELKVVDTSGKEHIFSYEKRRNYQDGNKIILKNYEKN